MDRAVIRTTAPAITKRVRSNGNLLMVAMAEYLEKSGADGNVVVGLKHNHTLKNK
jgi:hypothetical protein